MPRPRSVLRGVVFLAWLVMTAQCVVFVSRYGYDLPRQDEWEFVPVLCGSEPPLRWVVARHYEHRYPVARAVYLGLHAATGRDFRAGMWLSVGLLSAAAAVLLLAARKLRGESRLVDALMPALLLHAGHVENLTMGYQIAFTLTVGWLAAFVAAVAWADRLGPRRAAAACGLATLGVSLGGGIGWAFGLPLGLATLARVVGVCRASVRPGRDAVALLALPAAAGAYVLFSLAELRAGEAGRPANDLPTTLRVAFDFWRVAWGGAGRVGRPLPGLIAVTVAAESLVYAALAVARRDGTAAALAAPLAGAVLLSLAIGVGRPLGDESRYAVFGGFGLCVVMLTRTTAPRPAALSPGFLLAPAVAAALTWQNWQVGREFTAVYEHRTAMLRRDARLGLPVNVLAERHVLFPVPQYAANFEQLYASGHRSLRGAGPPRPLRAVPIGLEPGARLPAYSGTGPAPELVIELPESLAFDTLRLEFDCPDSRYQDVYRLDLPGQADQSAGEVSLWLVPGRRTALFRVEGAVRRLVVRPLHRTAGLELTRCEGVVYGRP